MRKPMFCICENKGAVQLPGADPEFLEGGFKSHTCDISLFRRNLPIFQQISLFEILKFPYITFTSPYFKFQIPLFEIKNFLLCLIILPISKSKSPYLASQINHMYEIHQGGFVLNIFAYFP